MEQHIDSAEQRYVNVSNIRITYLPTSSWAPGSPALRIQAYRNGTDNSLHQGAEIPIGDPETVLGIIAAITSFATNR